MFVGYGGAISSLGNRLGYRICQVGPSDVESFRLPPICSPRAKLPAPAPSSRSTDAGIKVLPQLRSRTVRAVTIAGMSPDVELDRKGHPLSRNTRSRMDQSRGATFVRLDYKPGYTFLSR